MNKRGLSNIVLVAVFAVIVVILIAWLGFRGISSMSSQRQITQEAEFQVELMQRFEVLRHSFGSVETVSLKAPESIKMVCIYDRQKPAFPPIAVESAALRQQLYFAEAGDTENNIFIVKDRPETGDEEIVALKKAEVRTPVRLSCFKQQSNKVSFYIEGKGKEIVVK